MNLHYLQDLLQQWLELTIEIKDIRQKIRDNRLTTVLNEN